MSSGGSAGPLAVVGGGAGFLLGGPAGAALGAGLGGMIGSNLDVASANEDAAAASGQIATMQLAEQRRTRELATAAAQPSEQEINALTAAINTNNNDIKRMETILASTDPAIIAAGRQANELLAGKEASVLAPMRLDRQDQRTKLIQKLKAQLGPGYETSSAGIQALSQFDRDTNSLLQNAQSQTLGQLLGVAAPFSHYGTTQQAGMAGSLAAQRGSINNRMISAINGTPINAGLAGAGALFGAQAAGQNANNMGQLFGTIAGLGAAKLPVGGSGGDMTLGAPEANAGNSYNNQVYT